jgi:hypothetical protein
MHILECAICIRMTGFELCFGITTEYTMFGSKFNAMIQHVMPAFSILRRLLKSSRVSAALLSVVNCRLSTTQPLTQVSFIFKDSCIVYARYTPNSQFTEKQ